MALGQQIDWTKARFKAVAIILGQDGSRMVLDVARLQADFDLGGIPQCHVTAAVGRDTKSLLPSVSHLLGGKLRTLLPIRIWLKAFELASSVPFVPPWPKQPFPIFDGYVVSAGFQKTRAGAGVNLGCIHWLSDMAFSSAASRSSAPNNPAQYSFGASYRLVQGGGGVLATSGLPGTFVTADKIRTDFWGDALVKWFESLCMQDRLQSTEIQEAIDVIGKTNYEALRALLKFEGAGVLDYRYSAPISMGLRGEGADDPILPLAANSIASVIGLQTPESVATATLWDKLAGEVCSQFNMAVVPMIDRALVVPICPNLTIPDPRAIPKPLIQFVPDLEELAKRNQFRTGIGLVDTALAALQVKLGITKPNQVPKKAFQVGLVQDVQPDPEYGLWTVLYPWEYDALDLQSMGQRPIRGVGLFAGYGASMGGGLGSAPGVPAIGGYFEDPVAAAQGGLIHYKAAPRWLAEIPNGFGYLNQAAHPQNNIGMVVNPGGGIAPVQVNLEDLTARTRGIMDDHARALFGQEVLRGRHGSLRTRFRLDIAPGSMVGVRVADDPFVLLQAPILAQGAISVLHSIVTRVSIVLDSESQQAMTLLQLSHYRTALEAYSSVSVFKHPLYDTVFLGAPLIDLPEFDLRPPEAKAGEIVRNIARAAAQKLKDKEDADVKKKALTTAVAKTSEAVGKFVTNLTNLFSGSSLDAQPPPLDPPPPTEEEEPSD